MRRAEHAPPEESAPEGLRAIFSPVVRKFGEVSHELGDGIKDVGEAWKARVEDVGDNLKDVGDTVKEKVK